MTWWQWVLCIWGIVCAGVVVIMALMGYGRDTSVSDEEWNEFQNDMRRRRGERRTTGDRRDYSDW